MRSLSSTLRIGLMSEATPSRKKALQCRKSSPSSVCNIWARDKRSFKMLIFFKWLIYFLNVHAKSKTPLWDTSSSPLENNIQSFINSLPSIYFINCKPLHTSSFLGQTSTSFLKFLASPCVVSSFFSASVSYFTLFFPLLFSPKFIRASRLLLIAPAKEKGIRQIYLRDLKCTCFSYLWQQYKLIGPLVITWVWKTQGSSWLHEPLHIIIIFNFSIAHPSHKSSGRFTMH